MEWIDALILGIIQGLAEYLPISSSGHLEIFGKILHINLSGADSLQFDLVLHVATVLSTIVVLRKRFVPLCTSFFGGNLLTVGICLCVTAALLTFAHVFRNRDFRTGANAGRNISWSDAFVMGIGQAVAVLPGLSRSGTTIATGIILGDKRDQVAQFSFFMVIIPILGEALLDIVKIMTEGGSDSPVGFLPMAIGFMASFIVGCLACKWMIELVSKGRLVWFAIYCVIVGVVCICW